VKKRGKHSSWAGGSKIHPRKVRNEEMSLPVGARIDNDIYDRMSDLWWSEHGFAALLRHVSNPWRVPYFQRVLFDELNIVPRGKPALDIGCGGGVLAEEFAAMGFAVFGIDPSQRSIEVARAHGEHCGLKIDYRRGHGGDLPFENGTFDIVYCCDVLEHVEDWDSVIGEAARVLKTGGVFFYDTINRTTTSKIVFIKMGQEWRFTRYLPPNLHAWEMFITPEELTASMERYGLLNKDIKGTKPAGNPLKIVMKLRQYNKGRMTAAELVDCIGKTQEGPDIGGIYMGYAVKP
jgi:2-polyprenyl-6-hydroxyphenyl methylase/3-demethylubiquinone-9 3-methyltransferase